MVFLPSNKMSDLSVVLKKGHFTVRLFERSDRLTHELNYKKEDMVTNLHFLSHV